MRIALATILVALGLFAGVTSGLACPVGYQPCGTQYCCPL
jgi:hypothetical protein